MISVCFVVLGCVCFRGFVLFLGCLGASLLLCFSSERREVILLWVSPFFSFGVGLKKFCRVVYFRSVALHSFWNISLAFSCCLGIVLVFSCVVRLSVACVGCTFIACSFRLGLACGIC